MKTTLFATRSAATSAATFTRAPGSAQSPFALAAALTVTLTLTLGLGLIAGCASKPKTSENKSFFTSGNKEADQRASQRMAKSEELAGSGGAGGEKGGDKDSKKNSGSSSSPGGAAPGAATAPQKTSLYDRLGAEPGISNIVADVLPRLLQDPRVNWDRKGVKSGGLFHHAASVTWSPTPQNQAMLKQHLIEFLALATGGPAHYTGREIKQGHAGMQISNPEFDAAVGDLKASLDRLKIPNTEQKELLAIVESTRPEIVEER